MAFSNLKICENQEPRCPGMIPLDDAMQKVMARIFAMNDVGARNLALQSLLGRGWQTNVETLKMLAEQG
jgi:hypothetical protein